MVAAREDACPYARYVPDDSDGNGPAGIPRWVSRARAGSGTSVVYIPEFEAWCVTRYSDNKEIALDVATFSSKNNNELIPMDSTVLRAAFPNGHPGAHSMLKKDGDEHTRLRRAADFAFNRKAMRDFLPAIESIVDELIDDFAAESSFDFVSRYAVKLPVRTILRLAGIPRGQEDDFMAWGHDSFALIKGSPPLTEAGEREIAERAVRVQAWMLEFVAARRSVPCDDLTTRLLSTKDSGGRQLLADEEVVGVVNSLLTAGIITTSTLLPLLVRSVLADERTWARIRSEPAVVDRAVEEALRLWSPARAARRLVTRDVEIDGIQLQRGDSVFLLWGAANHDPEVFPEPSEFDVDRADLGKHVAFGKGVHFCLGASLARAQAGATLRRLAARLPSLRIADPDHDDVSYSRRHNMTPVPTLNSLVLTTVARPGIR
jgi:cytochrome P450